MGDINGIITVAHSEAAEGDYFTMYAGSHRGQFVAGRQMRGEGSLSDYMNLTIIDQVMPDKGDSMLSMARHVRDIKDRE